MEENPFDDLEPDSDADVEEVDATDAAVDLAVDEGINLDNVEGTGANGRILLGDVEDHVG